MTPPTLRPTHTHPDADRYTAPGGAWDVPTLDTMMSAVSRQGDTIVDPSAGVRFDAEEVDDRVTALAIGLRSAGVAKGDAVAWQLPNGWASVLLFRACWRIGAVAAPLHARAGASETERMLHSLSPSAVLAAEGLPLASNDRCIGVRDGSGGFEELLEAHPPPSNGNARGEATEPALPEDPAVVLFTSGSGGAPKAALHTHRGLAYKARCMARVHGLTPHDCVLMPAPLAHVSGLLNGVLIPGVVPMRSVLMDAWNPERALELIEREHVTFMIGPPTFFVTLMDTPGFSPRRVRSLRLVSSGGAGITPAFVERARDALGARVKRTYGSTEAPTVTTSDTADDVETATTTDGHSTGEAELRVVDPDSGADRGVGEAGELWLRGPELFAGYLDPEETNSAVCDGWFRTGDLATLDRRGRLRIVGRIKDVIIRAGENVSVSVVENLLEAHPAVRQAVVVGTPDERLGEMVVACVVAEETFDLETCREWFVEQGAARFTTPERIVHLETLPTLAAGKPDRAALVALVAQA
ncbi:MAG: AMP-binding protein [Acidimicrobiia bacterium]|nr:AMP-binding protein [Acidimicrobiia bacterium]